MPGSNSERPACARRPVDQFGIRRADAAIDLKHAEPEIEQHRVAILRAQRLRVRPELGQHGAAAHRASRSGRQNATRWLQPCVVTVSNAIGRRSGRACEPDAAARRDDRGHRLLAHDLRRLVRIAHEFRDGAERAEAPLRLGIGELVSNQFERTLPLPALRFPGAIIVDGREIRYCYAQ